MKVLELLILVVCAIGIKMIFDARIIVEDMFSSSEKIKTIKIVKIAGTIISFIGFITLYILK